MDLNRVWPMYALVYPDPSQALSTSNEIVQLANEPFVLDEVELGGETRVVHHVTNGLRKVA